MAISDWTLPQGGNEPKAPTDWSKVFPGLSGGAATSAEQTAPAVPHAAPQTDQMVSKPASDYENMGIGDVLSQAVQNTPSSAKRVFSGLYHAATNPSETLQGLEQLGSGIASKASGALGGESHPEKEGALNALLNEYADTYGSWGGFKKRLAEDPFFIGMDAASLIPGVGGGLKAAGVGEKAVNALNIAAKVADPIQGAIAAAKIPSKLAGAVGKSAASAASGVPKVALDMAQEIGRSGDKAGQEVFKRFVGKQGNPQEIADTAVNALNELKQKASQEYLTSRAGIASSNVQLPMGKIVSAMNDLENFVNTHGTTTRFNAARSAMADVKNQIQDTINNIGNNPRVATMEDLDVLKQSIQDIAQSFRGTRFEGKFGSVAGAVKDTIASHDATYAGMMERYQNWIEQMKDLRQQLVGSANAGDSTRIAKLMKALGNDRKMDLLKMLSSTQSGKYLAHMIAGSALSSWFPSRIQGLGDLLLGGGLYQLGVHPAAVAGGALLASPKLGGKLAYTAGAAGRNIDRFTPQAYVSNPLSMIGNQSGDETEPQAYKRGGRVSSHEAAADQLVRAAERAKQGQSAATEALLQQPDSAIVQALEVANRSI